MFFKKKIKIGVAFGGGGARGFSHLGVIKAFEEFGLKFDRIAGTSAGALVGAFYAAGHTYKQMYEIAKGIKLKDIKTNIVPFVPSKLDKLGEIMRDCLGDIRVENLKTPFSAVAVDLISTKEVCFSKGNLAKVVMGSCAVPTVFQPIEYKDMILADGGLQNTIPADILRHYGCDYVIAIDVNKSRTYGTHSTKLMDVAYCSIRILMKSNAVRGYLFSDLVVAPETKRFSAKKTDGMKDMIDEGYKAAIDAMPIIMKIFKSRKSKKVVADMSDVEFVD